VHFSFCAGWRETKNTCLIKATHPTFDEAPRPEPPACLCDPQHVGKIAQSEALSVAASCAADGRSGGAIGHPTGHMTKKDDDWRPKRLVRTAVNSMNCSGDFGRQRTQETQRRRFLEGVAKGFLGNSLPWNWTIWNSRWTRTATGH
jgi:hypothetical protein